jgi:hypothetical protein
MKLLRPIIWFALCLNCSMAVSASRTERTPARPKVPELAVPDQPFSTFRSIDQILTILDQNAQVVRSRADSAVGVRSRATRARVLRQLKQSHELRDITQSVRKLNAISRRAESVYRNRHQRYGALLFRNLHAKAIAMQKTVDQQRRETNLTAFLREQHRLSNNLLGFVLQFQAVSGGYGALACEPGGWACCQPRVVRQDERTVLRGCSWQCASKIRACKDGCLGPRTPNTAAAIRPKKPAISRAPTHENRNLPGISDK